MVGLLNQPWTWGSGNPAWSGLLGLGQGLAQAGAPSPYPNSFMTGLGQGGAGFAQGVQQFKAGQAEAEMSDLRRRQIEAEIGKNEADATRLQRVQDLLFPKMPASGTSDTPSKPPAPPGTTNPVSLGDYYKALGQRESSGNPQAQSPTSSASGLYGFTTPTWQSMGGTGTAGAASPDSQLDAAKRLTEMNAAQLSEQLGRTPTDFELYAAHHFGAEGAMKLLRANPNTPVADIFGPAITKANPYLEKLTAGTLLANFQKDFGSGTSWQGGGGQPVQVADASGDPLAGLSDAQKTAIMLSDDPGAALAKVLSEGDKTERRDRIVGSDIIQEEKGPDGKWREIGRGERWQTRQEGESRDFSQAKGMRDEFSKLTKDYRDTSAAYQKIKSAAAKDSAAGDLSLIFGYMKLLDPGSTVREGEFATAQNAAGVPQQILNWYNRVMSGERLAPEQRADFAAQANNVFSVYQRQFDTLKSQYTDLATRQGIDPKNVIIEGGIPDAAPSGPQVLKFDAQGNLIQ